METKVSIKEFAKLEGQTIAVNGWVMNSRDGKGILFIILRDGSGFAQCVVEEAVVGEANFAQAKTLTQESAIRLVGVVHKDERQVGGYELKVTRLDHIYQVADGYPITPKEHGIEFLTKNRHLWLRSRRQWAIMRVRNRIIMSIHEFFQGEGFVQMDAPLFTPNACEGTSDLFETDFFGRPAYLSQSGQLYGEAMGMAMGKIYTFGPTFRAEKSVTRRHLNEFWMIEPEIAFYDLEDNMNLIERFIRSVVNTVLTDCAEELTILERNISALEKVNKPFPRVLYEDAVKILRGEMDTPDGRNAIALQEADLAEAQARMAAFEQEIAERDEILKNPSLKKGERNFHTAKRDTAVNEMKIYRERCENIPKWIDSAKNFEDGEDLGGSDETVLTRVFDAPVMVYNWPTKIKAFYMKEVEGDPDHVKGVDLLAPEGYGEIIGGSERETDLDTLLRKIEEHKLPQEIFEWYLDLRRYGSVPHAGFGLGLERVVTWITGIDHVREAIPFPRRFGTLEP